jgi:methionine-gamma-lyase
VKEAHSQEGVVVIADNTFLSPVLFQPLKWGVDLVCHSITKYINGHSDVLGGCTAGRRSIIERIRRGHSIGFTGAVMSPFTAFLVTRGLQTLETRIRQCSENAQQVAEFLESNTAVQKVYYPGLVSHDTHEVAAKQSSLYGSVITFELKLNFNQAKTFLNNVKLITLAVSLGGCESLIQHPASMTHAAIPREERLACGLTDGMIRFAVGTEGADDIIADLKQALDVAIKS